MKPRSKYPGLRNPRWWLAIIPMLGAAALGTVMFALSVSLELVIQSCRGAQWCLEKPLDRLAREVRVLRNWVWGNKGN